jgi:hypothetical protein
MLEQKDNQLEHVEKALIIGFTIFADTKKLKR